MIKVIPPQAWGDALPPPELVKVASTGLRGYDLATLIKKASHPLATWVRENPPKPGEVYIHAVAMGATERVGPNRNSDGYTSNMLRRDHPTFEKYARWFRDHKNQNPAISYGVVRRSHFDEDLQRVDTVTALNGTKQAAEANGGLVADKELSHLESDRPLDVSMSCKVSHDVCNLCGHKAKHRGEYCLPESDGGTCKYAGCRNALGRVYDDGAHQFVDNPSCSFFDLSNVSATRGADRTAFVTGKVAGAYVPGGAELAELMGLVPPEHLLEPAALAQLRCLRKLAAVAARATSGLTWAESLAVREKVARVKGKDYTIPYSDPERHQLLGDLARDGVCLPLPEWLHVVTGVGREKCATAIPNGVSVDRDLLARPDLHDLLTGTFGDSRVSPVGSYSWMAPSFVSQGKEAAVAVVKAASVRGTKVAYNPLPEAQRSEIAARYLAYQSAVLATNENSANFPLLLSDCAGHTRPIA